MFHVAYLIILYIHRPAYTRRDEDDTIAEEMLFKFDYHDVMNVLIFQPFRLEKRVPVLANLPSLI